jgi:poly-gamma-glutamate synthesis protein (capsule biosynthesis protein)
MVGHEPSDLSRDDDRYSTGEFLSYLMRQSPFRIGVATLALVLAACGSSGANDTEAVSTTVASTTTVATTTTTEPKPTGFSMAFTGDVLIHSYVWEEARDYASGNGYDFAPMFAEIKPILQSVDLAICHLEVPIAPAGEEPQTFPFYAAPVELVAGLKWAGYERCSTASNHTIDQGIAGVEATIAAFKANKLGQSGMANVPADIEPKVFRVNGFKVTHLSYTWGYNGIDMPNGEDWRSALINADRIIDDAKKARAMGAQFVVVSMHWGSEPLHEITRYQRENAEAITASGAVDLIVGHHSHVLQPIEQVNGVWTVFGLGNILSSHPTREFFPPESQDGAVVTVNVDFGMNGKPIVGRPVVYPTWVDKNDGYVIRDVGSGLFNPNTSSGLRQALQVSLDRSRKYVGDFIP